MKQIPLAIGLGPEPGFDNFVTGPNSEALHALTHWRQPGPPVFLHGRTGTGKSHLLAAWAARVRGQGAQVAWFNPSSPLPWQFDEAWTLIVIDDAQDLDEARQHAAFTLFVEAATHGTQMAAAARVPPVDLPLREDLRTRFGWGPVFELQPLDEAATRAVLRREADARGLMLSDEVMDYLLTRFERDLGSLKNLLHRLDRFSLAERRAVTVPLLKKMLTEGEGGRMKLALFDLDGTLLPTDSDHAFGEFMCTIGWTDGAAWRARNQQFFEQYQAGTLVLADYVDFASSAWRHRPLAEAEAARERFMQEVIGPALRFEAIELVRAHQRSGDQVAVVTATNEFVTRPIATAFGVETLLAVELERGADGRATGAIRGTPTFREGKVARVQAWLQGQGQSFADFDDVLFYSDSTNDLPLLEAVPTPVATNPTPALRQIALERGWRIIDLFEAP